MTGWSMSQLSLFELCDRSGAYIPVRSPKSASRFVSAALNNHVAWVGKNSTARGAYYHFYWQDRTVAGRTVTCNRYIRGSRVGSELGEQRRSLVESWIDQGLAPVDICRRLEALPRSSRSSKYPVWDDVLIG